MIRVMIRHIDEEFGTDIGEFSPDQIDSLPQLVKRYGSFADGNECDFVAAQFVANQELSKRAFFEIVVDTAAS